MEFAVDIAAGWDARPCHKGIVTLAMGLLRNSGFFSLEAD